MSQRSSVRRLALLLLASAVITLAALAVAATSGAATPRERALELVAMTHESFAAIARGRPAPFDWSTDGCSRTPHSWARRFEGPCRQHDFGYRNIGRGLRLWRSEVARLWIDGRFLTELRRVCAARFTGVPLTSCRAQAGAMHIAVRVFNAPWS